MNELLTDAIAQATEEVTDVKDDLSRRQIIPRLTAALLLTGPDGG
jgi:hypothetical protein